MRIIDNLSSTIEFFVLQNNRIEVLIYAADVQFYGTRGINNGSACYCNVARARYTRKVKIDCFAQYLLRGVIISVRTLRFKRLL